MPTTIKKIAKLSGVSITTVSKILNGKDHDLSQATIARVKAIIEQENYYPSILAQSMRNSQMKLIALMIPDVRNPFFTDVIRGCEDCANKYGYSLVFCNSDNILEKEVNYIRSLQSRHIDGIVLSGLQIESKIKAGQYVQINDGNDLSEGDYFLFKKPDEKSFYKRIVYADSENVYSIVTGENGSVILPTKREGLTGLKNTFDKLTPEEIEKRSFEIIEEELGGKINNFTR